MFFTIFEVLDIVVMTLVIGYLFHDIFRKPRHEEEDILDHYRHKKYGPFGIEWHDFWWAAGLIAPSILIHELAHKFTALAFGMTATFHAACSTAALAGWSNDFVLCGLTVLAVLLKAVGFGFLFFVPGYVETGAGGTAFQHALVAVAGPMVHLVFWLGAAYLLHDKKRVRHMPHKHRLYLFFFKQINMFLFILNMLPIPGFDGFNFFYNLFKAIFGF